MRGPSKKEYVDCRLKQAKETLEAAKTLAKQEHWNSVINRLYYSCFYAISALLYRYDFDAESHSGIKHQFGQNFVKPGLIDKSIAAVYIDLFDYRQAGDYADFVDFDKEKTLPFILQAENLLVRIQELIKEK